MRIFLIAPLWFFALAGFVFFASVFAAAGVELSNAQARQYWRIFARTSRQLWQASTPADFRQALLS